MQRLSSVRPAPENTPRRSSPHGRPGGTRQGGGRQTPGQQDAAERRSRPRRRRRTRRPSTPARRRPRRPRRPRRRSRSRRRRRIRLARRRARATRSPFPCSSRCATSGTRSSPRTTTISASEGRDRTRGLSRQPARTPRRVHRDSPEHETIAKRDKMTPGFRACCARSTVLPSSKRARALSRRPSSQLRPRVPGSIAPRLFLNLSLSLSPPAPQRHVVHDRFGHHGVDALPSVDHLRDAACPPRATRFDRAPRRPIGSSRPSTSAYPKAPAPPLRPGPRETPS